jgi:adenine C2-methylase RlmN of 23S rRNA A2503 and tRNA A37
MSANGFSSSREVTSQVDTDSAGTASKVVTVTNLLDITPEHALSELNAFMAEESQPAYRAGQVLHHLWEKPVASFENMSVTARPARTTRQAFFDPRLAIDTDQQSTDGTKFLFRLADGQAIETVAIRKESD